MFVYREGAGQGGLAKEEEGALLSQGIFWEGNGKDAIVQTASSSLVGRGGPHGRPPGEDRETPDQWVEVTFLVVAETAGRSGRMGFSTGDTSDGLGPVVEYILRVLHTPPCKSIPAHFHFLKPTYGFENFVDFCLHWLFSGCCGRGLLFSAMCRRLSWSTGFSGWSSRTLGPRLSH